MSDDYADFKTTAGRHDTPQVSGKTHRAYRFNGSDDGSENDDLSILVPEGAQWMGIEDNTNALAYEIHSAAAAGVEALDSRRTVDAEASLGLVPVTPGEYINISDQANSAVGAFTLIFEGGTSLPRGVGNLTVSDPGA